jgi:hypothetical protein
LKRSDEMITENISNLTFHKLTMGQLKKAVGLPGFDTNAYYLVQEEGNSIYYADWNQNNQLAANYIANRPCYSVFEDNQETVYPLAEKYIPTTVPSVQTAQVGQLLSVKSVDENGKPTEWEVKTPTEIFEELGFTVDENGTLVGGAVSGGGASASGFELIDKTTGDKYNVYIDNGKLTAEVV